jgi:signal transduction histidine kinase
MGEMIGNIAHQWRQPLNALGLVLDNVKDAFDFGELDRQALENAVADGNRLIAKMSSTIDDFRNFFRPGRGKAAFDLRAAVEDTVRLVEASYRNHNIEVRHSVPEGLRIRGYGNELSQVLLNFLSNAKDAIVAARVPRGRMEIGAEGEGDFAVITFSDNGGGIPAEVLPRIFEPYYTTKETGTGIGLYMSKLIVDHMGGCIAADNSGEGAVFVLRLPLAGEE